MPLIAVDASRVNANSVKSANKFSIIVKVEPDGNPIRLDGRVAWAMRELVKAGQSGCTPITHPGPRWSDYTHKLRKLGFAIETEYESHGGPFAGSHGIYRLSSPVVILEDVANAA
ncbi:hypothetical protein EN904_14795 [Mesorhizobium sp. M7A.F.Ca.CA.001.07.2.1]|uniref:winged helix domain-containing protein n=2 Tax=Phyllobacteriaceae TaxID=69277 RepID=UPI000FCB7BCE|nr:MULTISPECIES: hypothetical protein [Mesorhizobium]RVB42906.1 hypothetical protein EN918_08710 [Mesorhizobium sp. M7A.F.Ca.CA.004.05.1.1]MCF6124370.1 hypothetical protein [Mesorhizobium ciceri]MCQ8816669.1 hypothetical protein [Mesorhizobium sp. SEMIA396]RUX82467.1 hypothetical protein EN983_01145 [Mesorhizobium sp. M7A.F.Ca.CA.004.08.2.1]RUX87230.1 hypothetical protein EN982_11810 [Mesorhizobium sp. M7A.F.Ca.CA.004.08.1.1]